MKALKEFLLYFIPRFITDDVAVALRPDGGYDMVCGMDALYPGEEYDGVITLDVFTWFGYAIPCGKHGLVKMEVKPWPKGEQA